MAHRPHEYALVLVTPPSEVVVDRAECKAAMGITGTSQDAAIDAALAAAVAQLDPAGGGWLGRALRPQTWELRLEDFYHNPSSASGYDRYRNTISLPYPPLISVDSITYDDTAGVAQTMVEGTDFRVLGLGSFRKQAIAPVYGKLWPAVRYDREAVRIRFTAGYVKGSSSDLPNSIKQAVFLAVNLLTVTTTPDYFLSQQIVPGVLEQRFASSASDASLTATMQNLLASLRVY